MENENLKATDLIDLCRMVKDEAITHEFVEPNDIDEEMRKANPTIADFHKKLLKKDVEGMYLDKLPFAIAEFIWG